MKREKLPDSLKFEVLERDHYRCVYCGATALDARLEVDHYQPVASGGTNDLWNLVTACSSCNRGKSDRDWFYACPTCVRPTCEGPFSSRDWREADCQCKCHICKACNAVCTIEVHGSQRHCPAYRRHMAKEAGKDVA